jgi:hypothetical protein
LPCQLAASSRTVGANTSAANRQAMATSRKLARHAADLERRNEQLDAMLRLQMVTARGAIDLIDRLKGVLSDIADDAGLDCGCSPCKGACYSARNDQYDFHSSSLSLSIK